jgi:hypothetical protein
MGSASFESSNGGDVRLSAALDLVHRRWSGLHPLPARPRPRLLRNTKSPPSRSQERGHRGGRQPAQREVRGRAGADEVAEAADFEAPPATRIRGQSAGDSQDLRSAGPADAARSIPRARGGPRTRACPPAPRGDADPVSAGPPRDAQPAPRFVTTTFRREKRSAPRSPAAASARLNSRAREGALGDPRSRRLRDARSPRPQRRNAAPRSSSRESAA